MIESTQVEGQKHGPLLQILETSPREWIAWFSHTVREDDNCANILAMERPRFLLGLDESFFDV